MQYKCFFAQKRTRFATSRASIYHQRKQIEFTQNRLLTTEIRRQKNGFAGEGSALHEVNRG